MGASGFKFRIAGSVGEPSSIPPQGISLCFYLHRIYRHGYIPEPRVGLWEAYRSQRTVGGKDTKMWQKFSTYRTYGIVGSYRTHRSCRVYCEGWIKNRTPNRVFLQEYTLCPGYDYGRLTGFRELSGRGMKVPQRLQDRRVPGETGLQFHTRVPGGDPDVTMAGVTARLTAF